MNIHVGHDVSWLPRFGISRGLCAAPTPTPHDIACQKVMIYAVTGIGERTITEDCVGHL
jgi:hypothetical protein